MEPGLMSASWSPDDSLLALVTGMKLTLSPWNET